MAIFLNFQSVITKTVSTPGTAVPLASSETYAKRVVIQAGRSDDVNAGKVYLGDSSVDKDSNKCLEMSPGDVFCLPMGKDDEINLAHLYIDADNSGDGVRVLYWA